jgi:hypothetical protein
LEVVVITGRRRLLAQLMAAGVVGGLAACSLASGPSYTFEPIPGTCTELTEEIHAELFETLHLSEPDRQVEGDSGNEPTRSLRCSFSGESPDLPTSVRAMVVSIAQVAREPTELDGMTSGDWLRDQASAALQGQAHLPGSCAEPTAAEVEGTQFALACHTVEQDRYVTTIVVAVLEGTRAWVWVSAQGSDDTEDDADLADLELDFSEFTQRAAGMLVRAVEVP